MPKRALLRGTTPEQDISALCEFNYTPELEVGSIDIKKHQFEGDKLEFGTELVCSKDGKITCLLGASPGASTSLKIMLDVVERAFPQIMDSAQSITKLLKMVPSYLSEPTKKEFEKLLHECEVQLNLDKSLKQVVL